MLSFGIETMMRPQALLDNRGFGLPGNVPRCAGLQWMDGAPWVLALPLRLSIGR